MGRIGKISVIPKDYTGAFATMEKSLRDNGMSRAPGTARMIFPFLELSGKYRTGLDENAKYLARIEDDKQRGIEIARIKQERTRLQDLTGLDLSPSSKFYNHTSKVPSETPIKVHGVKLIDGDNIYHLEDAMQAITFAWLSVHPSIASSLEAYSKGRYPSDTQFYVNNEDVESEVEYFKKKTANDAIIRFDSWSLEKRRKVARLLDLPVSEETKEAVVYNMVDTFLKNPKIAYGVHQGKDPIKVFGLYADIRDDRLLVMDLIEQAIKNNVYKVRTGGGIYEGELQVYKSKDEMITDLLDDNNQDKLLDLEKKLKIKRLVEV